jgi:hypothetical protein
LRSPLYFAGFVDTFRDWKISFVTVSDFRRFNGCFIPFSKSKSKR